MLLMNSLLGHEFLDIILLHCKFSWHTLHTAAKTTRQSIEVGVLRILYGRDVYKNRLVEQVVVYSECVNMMRVLRACASFVGTSSECAFESTGSTYDLETCSGTKERRPKTQFVGAPPSQLTCLPNVDGRWASAASTSRLVNSSKSSLS